MKKTGKLYLVSTPIGNWDDITVRALNILKNTECLVCEEFKIGRRILAQYGIQKELYSINEHNEKENSEEILGILQSGKDVAMFSDAGSPVFSDPGNVLVQLCIGLNIKVIPLPGANSVITALMGAGLPLDHFYFMGWLSPKKDIRRKQLLEMKSVKDLIILMDTPYRLKSLVEIMAKFFPNNYGVIGYKLTMNEEQFLRGNFVKLYKIIEKKKLKGEFVLILDNRK